MSKNLSCKYRKKLSIMLNNLQHMRLKLLQKEQFKKKWKQLVIKLVIKLLIELQKFQKNSQQNNSDTVTNENDKEIPKERYISPEKSKKLLMI